MEQKIEFSIARSGFRSGGGGGRGTPLFGLYGYLPLDRGMVFWTCCPKQGIQFDLPLS